MNIYTINFRSLSKTMAVSLTLCLAFGTILNAQDNRPNVLFISIDEVPAEKVAALKAVKARTWTVPGANIKMVRIPAGQFVMGSPKEEPHRFSDETQRTVSITKPFT